MTLNGVRNKILAKEDDLLIAVTDFTRNADIIAKAILVPDYYGDLVYSMDIAKVIPKQNLTESPKNLLQKFDKIYKPIAKRISETAKQNQKLAELRDWLLRMLMNGK